MIDALRSKYVVISVMGPYAGESEGDIFRRKTEEIEKHGFTFWHHQSYQAQPGMVQQTGEIAAREGELVYFILTRTGSRGSGTDTKRSRQATMFSKEEFGVYSPIPEGIYVETGKRPYAIVIRGLILARWTVDLWEYCDMFGKGAVKTRQGGSTVCVFKASSHHIEDRMKSRFRDVIAYAEIIEPFSVWLR